MPNFKLIVGLGNPGVRYTKTRHNVGFQCVRLYAERHQIDMGKTQQRAAIGDGWVQRRLPPTPVAAQIGEAMSSPLVGTREQRQRVLLAQPLTYMNESGASVGPLADYYDIPLDDILVIHDDLDLPLGKLRLRGGGGSGGQKGIKSLIQHLGDPGFARARVGIGRPPGRMAVTDYVLQNFSARDEEEMAITRQEVLEAVDIWVFEGIEAAMNRFNSKQ